MKKLQLSLITLSLMASSHSALAAANASDIARLGNELTPWGAIKAANAEGTIPAYGVHITPPSNYDPTKPGVRPDPFASEKPLLSITASNAQEHADKLSKGQLEMFKQYPNFRMDIYPTHRTAKYPDYVVQNTLKNAETCQLADNKLQLTGTCWGGVPFPIPANGSEVMWNRALKYDQFAYYSGKQSSIMVGANGVPIETGAFSYWQTFPAYAPDRSTPLNVDEVVEYGRIDWTGPNRKAGEKLVIHDTVDMSSVPRRSWTYMPGQRRVKLSPDVAYDTPSPAGGGIGTTDDTQVFYGSQDRYDFKLIGKKEMYIPYNTFKLHDATQCSNDKVFTVNFLNPDCVRWELHRVWEVEATLKPGKRHVYPKRTFYWDEDIPAVGMADNYDDAGKIYRVTFGHYYPFYETDGHNTHDFVVYDLVNKGYVRQAFTAAGQAQGMMVVTKPEDAKPSSFYQPNTLSASGIR